MADADLKCKLCISFLRKLCRAVEGNFVISPLSLGTAFAMLSAGLRGETKTELLQLLGTDDEEKLHALYSDLSSKKNLPLKIANKYLADQDCEVHQKFESLLKTKYQSEVECVNFAKDAREIEVNVNKWVAAKTEKMIPELLPKGTLDASAVLVLLNAIYFKGTWMDKFEVVPDSKDFTLRSGEKIQCSFMTKSSTRFGYGETGRLRLVTIPYVEEGFSMLVAIPKNEKVYIGDVIASMEPPKLIEAMRTPRCQKKVILTMPKFKIEYDFGGLKNCMKDLGVNKIFVPDDGDFGDLYLKTKRSPFVAAIIHKAVIEVDEEGTKAAAATAIVKHLKCLREPPPTVNVNLDRPFCFFITSPDGIVCFSGICAQP